MPEDELYLPVQVGAIGKESIGFQRDDEGENISFLNPFFCELTAMYWAWKNLEADYIGLAHYRRHFAGKYRKDPWQRILQRNDLEKNIGRIRVFVPNKRRYWIESLYSHYAHTHDVKQLEETRKILEEKHSETITIFDQILRQRWGYMFNMMIMQRSFFDAYCAWLFDLLFELRKRLGEDGLSPFDSRYYGRISEILFNVWLREQIVKGKLHREEVQEIKVIHMEKINWVKKGFVFLKAKFLGKKYKGYS